MRKRILGLVLGGLFLAPTLARAEYREIDLSIFGMD